MLYFWKAQGPKKSKMIFLTVKYRNLQIQCIGAGCVSQDAYILNILRKSEAGGSVPWAWDLARSLLMIIIIQTNIKICTDKQTNIKICILFFRLLSIKFLADHLTKIMKQFIFCGFLIRSSTDPEWKLETPSFASKHNCLATCPHFYIFVFVFV